MYCRWQQHPVSCTPEQFLVACFQVAGSFHKPQGGACAHLWGCKNHTEKETLPKSQSSSHNQPPNLASIPPTYKLLWNTELVTKTGEYVFWKHLTCNVDEGEGGGGINVYELGDVSWVICWAAGMVSDFVQCRIVSMEAESTWIAPLIFFWMCCSMVSVGMPVWLKYRMTNQIQVLPGIIIERFAISTWAL